MSAKPDPNKKQVVGLLGVGLDGNDEHKRVTRSDEMILVGGSEQTHEHMQDIAIKFAEALRKRGKRLPDAEVEEVIDLLHEASDG